MVDNAIIALRERDGSSRHAIKRYIFANYPSNQNISKINSAIKEGVSSGHYIQRMGPSGRIKLARGENFMTRLIKM